MVGTGVVGGGTRVMGWWRTCVVWWVPVVRVRVGIPPLYPHCFPTVATVPPLCLHCIPMVATVPPLCLHCIPTVVPYPPLCLHCILHCGPLPATVSPLYSPLWSLTRHCVSTVFSTVVPNPPLCLHCGYIPVDTFPATIAGLSPRRLPRSWESVS